MDEEGRVRDIGIGSVKNGSAGRLHREGNI